MRERREKREEGDMGEEGEMGERRERDERETKEAIHPSFIIKNDRLLDHLNSKNALTRLSRTR